MAKNKNKGSVPQGTRSSAPTPVNQRQSAPPEPPPGGVNPMVIIGIPALVLFVVMGGMAYQMLNKKDEPTPARVATVQPTTSSETRSSPPGQTKKAPVRGLPAHLPEDASSLFGSDKALADEFNQARSDLTGGKSPMAVRQKLEPMLGRASDNPGREYILAALSYTELRTREGKGAATHLDTLLQQFPNSQYAPLAKAMRIDAELQQASPTQKGVKPDPVAMKGVLDKAEALQNQSSDPEVKAYALFIQASVHDMQDDDEKAAQIYLSVADQFPETPQAVSSLVRAARAYRQVGKVEPAIGALERLGKNYPGDEALKEGGSMLRELRLIGKNAPELTVVSWPSGTPTTMAELKGKVVLVNFWQTWCPHCQEELPHLSALYEKYKDRGFVIIGATRDDSRQDEAKLTEFLQGHPLPFPIARVDNQTSRAYAISGIPAAALVDRQGIVRFRAHPNALTDAELESYLAQK